MKMAEGATSKTCPTCNGSGVQLKVMNTMFGQMQTQTTCGTCQGIGKVADKIPAGANAQGLIKDEEEVTINIPAGARDGIQLNVRGKGNDAPFGGIPGDLLVIIEEEVDKVIKREGDNLHQELYISFAEAALGTKKGSYRWRKSENYGRCRNAIRKNSEISRKRSSKYRQLRKR
jgi:molecular chaperone DnaJ